MTTQTIKVEVPEGYRLKKQVESTHNGGNYAVFELEKIQPSRIVFDEITDGTQDIDADYYIKYKWWREVKETDIAVNNDFHKLSLSVEQCRKFFNGTVTSRLEVFQLVEDFIKDK